MSLRSTSLAVLTVVVAGINAALAGPVNAQPVPNPYDAADPPSPRRARARAEPKGPEWSVFVGAWVEVKRTDGTVVRGRMWRISNRVIVVNLGKRSTVIPVTQIVTLRRLTHRPTHRPTARPTARPEVEVPPTRPASTVRRAAPLRSLPTAKKRFHVEWLTLFAFGGGGTFGWGFEVGSDEDRYIVGGAELGLFSFVWRHAYFDMLRLSGGVPYLFYLGTGFGVRGVLDSADKYELRLGLHVTCPYMFMFMPTMSGLDLKLLIRVGSKTRVHLGLKVFAFPPSAAAGVGISY